RRLLAGLLLASGLASADIAAPDPGAAPMAFPGDHIGTIYFKVGDIFDTTKPGENKALYRLANRLHIDTREEALRAQLLFAEGDVYSQRVVDETERALRRLRYIREPHVRVVDRHDGLVDLEVSASDVWTLSPGVSFGRKGGANHSGFEFDDFNVFGTGKRLSLGVQSDVDRTSKSFLYIDPNVFGTRWTTEASYSNNNDGDSMLLDVERPFFSFDTRWTAGVSLASDDAVQNRYSLGKRADEYRREMREADLHFGTSQGWDDGWVRRFTAGLRFDERRFSDAAGFAPSAILPTDHTFSYPYARFDFIQDDFTTAMNVDQIERTEDFEFGRRFMVELGYSDSAFGGDTSATLVRASASRGWRLHDHHTLFLGLGLSGRLEGGAARNSLYSASAKYYWRTSQNTLFHVALSGDVGHALDLDNELLLGGDNGLRGYPLRYQTGNSRALMTLEERFYTNWYPWRLFHVGGAVFADVGRTFGPSAIDVPNLGTLRDVGFGLRFSNSRSALANVLHIDFAFPLDGDSSIKNFQFLVGTQRSF
ncbi:MAG TPA: BamA/TamA family outer membrane protein, partial [Burkholderiaceae bacterium]|nr:BamA/TamA family outer membrane protein [Burkholderiaceae bacterium]